MNAALIGEFIGATLATAGAGYIWLAILWATRAYKRWPGPSYWSAAGVALMLGALTAISSGDYFIYGAATLLSCGFIVIRARQTLAKLDGVSPVHNPLGQ